MPNRLQRKRSKGFRLPDGTRCVTRPGPWGNPFRTAQEFREAFEVCSELGGVPPAMDIDDGRRVMWMVEHIEELRGVDLACFCGLVKECHADVLLEYANKGE